MVASVPSMIGQFNMDNICILIELGYDVTVACNFKDRSVWDENKIIDLIRELEERNVKIIQVDFTRKIFDLESHFRAYRKLVKIFEKNQYDFLHCHTPIASAVTRIAAHKMKIKTIYTAHGFHFYKGAPVLNWIMFYPIEKYLSKYTDILITINNEDYKRAKYKFKAKKVVKIPGVGINSEQIEKCHVDRYEMREKLNIPQDGFVLLSVGELSKRKNHKVILQALCKIKNPKIYYLIAGKGPLMEKYIKFVRKKGIQDNVKLLGFRKDIFELCKISDVFVHPSKREGLGIAALEGMASGLPLISSDASGIVDYSENGKTGYCCKISDVKSYANAIQNLYNNEKLREKMGSYSRKVAKNFDISKTEIIMNKVYKEI